MTILKRGDDVFSSGCDLIEATSLHRPDTAWVVVDTHGHAHRWCVMDESVGTPIKPAYHYRPDVKLGVPTLVWVKDGEEYWEDDDEPHDVGHLECRQCGEHIKPGYTADTNRQYVPGLRWFCINGESVSKDEFELRLSLSGK